VGRAPCATEHIRGGCVTPTGTVGGFVAVRLDAPRLLGAPVGRREAHHLSALSVAVALAEDANWRTNTVEPFRSVAWAGEHQMAWGRLRRALDHLASSGVARAELHPFQPGTATLTAREEPTSLLHDRARAEERFVPLARGALRSVAAEHGLSWVGTGLLVLLLLLCDHRSGELPEGCWTKTSLCERFGVGWRRLSSALEELEAAGLIAYRVRRGASMHLELLARSALVAPALASPRKRRERRQLRREAERGSGEAAEVAAALLGHFDLAGEPSAALVHAIAGALETGASRRDLLERLVARGSLAGATDPVAVLVGRARAVRDELVAAREANERRREAEAAERLRRAELEAAEAEAATRAADEDRWIASVLDHVPSAEDLGLGHLVARAPMLVAAHIRAEVGSLIERWPELDPVALVQRWAARPSPADALDTVGIDARDEASHGPPGNVPRARAGPRLVDRLSQHR
jgi:hypothetical protein